MAVIPVETIAAIADIVGAGHVRQDEESRRLYGTDGTKRSAPADLVVIPADSGQIAAIARLCNEGRIPLVPRGAGTGYSGGAVPTRGGVVMSLERLNRILEIDTNDLVAVVEPCVVTGALQEAVERVGLFYPPDPASLGESSIGGNIAENAGGPRGFKYGTTRNYVLGLEAVLPTGAIIRTGGRTVKNVAGYDLTSLIVGSEGTLAIVTRATLRLIPKPPASATMRVTFHDIGQAADGVDALLGARVVPASIELIDGACLGTSGAIVLVELDGHADAVEHEADRVEAACKGAGAVAVERAQTATERDELWRTRRELSPRLRQIAPVKVNNDIVVPRGRIPELFAVLSRLANTHRVAIPSFGHAGDGNIHVNIMVEDTPEARDRAHAAERELFEEVVRLNGAITGEHGVGFVKAPFLRLQLSDEEIALMRRVKAAFDPNGILNPGKIFPDNE